MGLCQIWKFGQDSVKISSVLALLVHAFLISKHEESILH